MAFRTSLFPASAGMNRLRQGVRGTARPVPRECGDEPLREVVAVLGQHCSPRVRG